MFYTRASVNVLQVTQDAGVTAMLEYLQVHRPNWFWELLKRFLWKHPGGRPAWDFDFYKDQCIH